MGETVVENRERKAYYRRLLEPLMTGLVRAPISKGDALRALGVRGEIHPYDVSPPMLYPDMRTALLFKRANREGHGNDVIGPREVDGLGILSVNDLRPFLLTLNDGSTPALYPTDPSLPDDWPK